jgi:hypothetical protein
MAGRKLYIVDMRGDGLSLIGPFYSDEDLRDWTARPEFNPQDDPRWQSVWLTDAQVSSSLAIQEPYR